MGSCRTIEIIWLTCGRAYMQFHVIDHGMILKGALIATLYRYMPDLVLFKVFGQVKDARCPFHHLTISLVFVVVHGTTNVHI